MTDILIGTIEKNKREQLRVTLKSFDDLRQVDIRVFKNVRGEFHATPQGCTVKPGKMREFIETLESAEAAVKSEGLA